MTDTIKKDQQNDHSELQNIIEAALFAADQAIGVRKIQALFDDQGRPEKEQVEEVIVNLQEKHANSGLDLVRIGAGWRFQTNEKYAPWLRKLSSDRAPGRPALFGTTAEFLSYFNLRGLSELPELIHERQFEEIAKEMNMEIPFEEQSANDSIEADVTEEHDIEEEYTTEVAPVNDSMEQENNESLDEFEIDEVDQEKKITESTCCARLRFKTWYGTMDH